MNPYPNTVSDEVVIEYIIPFEANVKITFYNQFGKLTHKAYDGPAKEGFNRHVFDVSTLAKGTYYYRIEYEGNVKSYSVIIN